MFNRDEPSFFWGVGQFLKKFLHSKNCKKTNRVRGAMGKKNKCSYYHYFNFLFSKKILAQAIAGQKKSCTA